MGNDRLARNMKLFYFSFAVICLASCASNSGDRIEQPLAEQKTETPTPKIEISKNFQFKYDSKLAREYEVVEVEDASLKAVTKPLSSYSLDEVNALPLNIRKTYRIVIPADIKEAEVKPTIEKAISKIAEEDDDIDEITLFLYSDKDIVKRPYDVATATWAPNGEWGSTTPEIARTNDRTSYKIDVEVKPNLEKYLKERGSSEEKFGLSDEERKRVYKELVATEDKAQAEADEMYPTDFNQSGGQDNSRQNSQAMEELKDKYRAQLAKKYNITEKQVWDITSEAFKKNWPLD